MLLSQPSHIPFLKMFTLMLLHFCT